MATRRSNPYYPYRGRITGNKYRNERIEVGGVKFDSKREARRYQELLLLEKAGEISELKTQERFILIPAQREPDTVGKRGGIKKGRVIERECIYVADFVYRDKEGNLVVEDTKGFRTKDYTIKRKLMLYVHGIQIQEL